MVTVNAAEGEKSAESVSAPNELTIEAGKSAVIAAALPEGAEGYLSYKTSNPNIATVSPTGRVFAVGTGTAYITVTADSGASKTVRIYAPEDEDTPEPESDVTIEANGKMTVSLNAVGDTALLGSRQILRVL